MPININSAYRVREILKDIQHTNDNTSMADVWAKSFGITENNPQKKNVTIARYLADLHDEVEATRIAMKDAGYSEELFEGPLNRCNNIFAVQNITSQWQSFKPQLTPDVLIALGYCSEILPNEEALMNPTELDELRRMAGDLREILKKSTLPKHVLSIIDKHLTKIEDAIPEYKILGSKALDDVVQSAYGEVIASEHVFIDAKGSQEVKALAKIWQQAKASLDSVKTVDSALNASIGLAQKGIKLLEFLNDL